MPQQVVPPVFHGLVRVPLWLSFDPLVDVLEAHSAYDGSLSAKAVADGVFRHWIKVKNDCGEHDDSWKNRIRLGESGHWEVKLYLQIG